MNQPSITRKAAKEVKFVPNGHATVVVPSCIDRPFAAKGPEIGLKVKDLRYVGVTTDNHEPLRVDQPLVHESHEV